jgi:hypothetical protein
MHPVATIRLTSISGKTGFVPPKRLNHLNHSLPDVIATCVIDSFSLAAKPPKIHLFTRQHCFLGLQPLQNASQRIDALHSRNRAGRRYRFSRFFPFGFLEALLGDEHAKAGLAWDGPWDFVAYVAEISQPAREGGEPKAAGAWRVAPRMGNR